MELKKLIVLTFLAIGLCAVARSQGGLRVGAAKVDQTGPMGASQTGKFDHEKLYARAIVLDNGTARAALISYEGPASFNTVATLNAIAAELSCPLENVIVTHTHTHSPMAEGIGSSVAEPSAGPSKEIVDAVRQAKANLEPAQMGFGTGAMYLNVNRDAIDPESRKWVQGTNLDAFSDKTVAVLTFENPSGEPIAVYVNYAMHPIDGYVSGVVTADFPGAMSRYVEKAFGDNIVVAFSQGTSGDQNPLYLRPSNNVMASRAGNQITGFQIDREASEGPLRMSYGKGHAAKEADPKVIDNLFQFIQSEGQVLGEEVIRVMTFTRNMSGDVRIEGMQKTVSCPGRRRTNGDNMDPKTREGVGGTYVDAPPVILFPGMLGIGTVAMTSVNGEVYSPIGRRVKDEAPMKNTVIVTLANLKLDGYIPDDASYSHQTFQVLNSMLKPGCAERGITDAIVEMETRYLNGK